MDKHALEMIDLELAILLRRITSNNKKFGSLDRSAYLLLHEIIKNGPAGVKALANEFHLDISTVSRQAASLEQKGYVFRIPDPMDGRAYSLEITELGRKEFLESRRLRFERFEEILGKWPEDERRIFGKLLHKYNQSSEEK